MRVIYLHPHFTAAGGAGRAVLEVGTRLAERGHDVHCVCIRADAAIVGDAANCMKFHEVGGPLSSDFAFWARFTQSCERVRKTVQRIAPDPASAVLFPQVFPANWWGASILKQHPTRPCVWFCQEPSAFIHSDDWIAAIPSPKRQVARILRPVLKRLDVGFCKRFSKVLVNSQFSLETTRRVYGYSEPQCEVVYLGVDLQRFHPPETIPDEPSVCTVAKLTRFKNVDKIIDAMAQLRSELGYEIRLDIVGDGDCKKALESQVKSLGLQNIKFHGRLSDAEVAGMMRKASLFCIASNMEPFGLVAIEALACGTPVVAVNNGGPREIFNNHKCGILVDEPAPSTLADAFQRLLTDSALHRELASNALNRAGDFEWNVTTEHIEQHLLDAIHS